MNGDMTGGYVAGEWQMPNFASNVERILISRPELFVEMLDRARLR